MKYLIAVLLIGSLLLPAFAVSTERAEVIKKELARLNKAYSLAKSAGQKKQIADKMLQYKAELKSAPKAQTVDTRIAAIKKELARLNKSYSLAKSAKQKKQIADKMLQYKARLKALQPPPPPAPLPPAPPKPEPVSSFSATIEAMPSVEAVPAVEMVRFYAPPPPTKKKLILPQVGIVASALYLGGEYLLLPTSDLDLMVSMGFGLGSGYSLTTLGVGTLFNTGPDTFIETAIVMANYSQKVSNIPGLQGAAEGSMLGVGLYGGEIFGNLRIKVGFSTVTGLCLTAAYLF
ncbi:hypothetical protein A3K48_06485 [candidate division WOR-1 bacterium RIFOXYA12_FULL_52_29]|uniref:Uncharacterized protein n=1 Tax=candidate division WOR-1 bacterium RIFOXYC12_FULL_54_18 TaxID=1802584 RepID=A0A1F4T7Q2_UNCSA|nr:MAG: hypothetical protein A3K44_06485 [candidate division WOR-1 bacterium RIFOXYA2_FULL_51_19]OGC18170.1 MAG: hypothetical protein A3K48_06485 [candidate division WOR-1 bacterium RIFOXYA12_FULL_52_29]OGC27025.1 MAG: hypothetical protein A3K32_06480 [candidate division WOR-1 bacterium RIFOXYB2_FULL_45_9]OGC28587.1 MAG: hypothetical protein A3K49_06485 [candidate division WOR-1 bacterium RIFOXYC12_FULL_54_18]OGC30958.1 MAG: hypothetical protein A2346_06135 [candidate division WOR-1 bacterium R